MKVQTLEQLRGLYPPASERSLRKQLSALEPHSRQFIALSPFLVVSSAGADGRQDASPRGGAPGFVQVQGDHTVLIPDAPGNNRLDTLENIVATGRVGLLFMVPGVDETLRINGLASLSIDPAHLALFADEPRPPRVVIEVQVQELYLHCAKALMRSKLWQPGAQVPREALPSMGEMIRSQTGQTAPAETQAEMLRRYQSDIGPA
ncbi:pyridoxamine 5'-phosphate oxidase family protein [Ideonella margarita]|uniref:Pyridoxamine 5'-phosphate oxidase family protein n=1 Tax=Ideonella margarita TaxID=2984191 RepID=A0ABU9C7A2_9BURK